MENNEFEVFNANEPLTSNVEELKNDIDLSNIDEELKNINISYVNDDSDIVEPELTNSKDVDLAEELPTIEPQEESKYTFDEAGTVVAVNGEEPTAEELPTIEPQEESKYTFDEAGTVVAVNGEEPVAEELPTIEPQEENKYTFDEAGTVVAVNGEEPVAEELPTIETAVIETPDTEEKTNFTFDENGTVISMSDAAEPVVAESIQYDTDSNETKLTKEELDAIEDIKKNRDIIDEQFKNINEIVNQAREAGIADTEYLAETFDKISVIGLVNERFSNNVDKYVDSITKDEPTETELSKMVF